MAIQITKMYSTNVQSVMFAEKSILHLDKFVSLTKNHGKEVHWK